MLFFLKRLAGSIPMFVGAAMLGMVYFWIGYIILVSLALLALPFASALIADAVFSFPRVRTPRSKFQSFMSTLLATAAMGPIICTITLYPLFSFAIIDTWAESLIFIALSLFLTGLCYSLYEGALFMFISDYKPASGKIDPNDFVDIVPEPLSRGRRSRSDSDVDGGDFV